jgi:hypothetical protein
MRATWVSVGIVWWAWIGRRPCFQRDDVDIVPCRWFTPISVIFPFTCSRSMASGLFRGRRLRGRMAIEREVDLVVERIETALVDVVHNTEW